MKLLNRIYIALLGVGLTATLNACDEKLDLSPANTIEQSEALLTSQDVKSALIGAYNRLGVSDLYGGRIFLEPDLLAGQSAIAWGGTYTGLTQIYSQSIPTNNTFVSNLWISAYEAINLLNNVLGSIDKVDTEDRDRVEGEAKFLRGLIYFDLVRLYGKAWNDGDPATNLGVPLVLTPTSVIDEESYVSRATVVAVYQQVLADLTDAKVKLPASNSFYANSYAASAILSRVYLQQGDYQNAANEATTVINSEKYQLVDNFADEFPYPGAVHVDNTLEDIFAFQVTPQQGSNSLNEFYASSDNGGRGDIEIKSSFIAQYEEGDERTSVYYDDAGSTRTSKFDNMYGNIKVIRLAELYLTRAESNLRLGTTIGDTPLNDINKIRTRANLSPATTVTVQDVLKQRELELAFEVGSFFHDAKRTEQSIGTLPYSSPKLVFPIPQREIYANPNIQQNQGY
ncbi:RagB/SusD family nutrient uptake outer membrane protein [Pontibacter silvestris]|uniref:RagB/SusD family nutrient uptake outer membrane protein n=1 Tax=Pontibacter silvestris TaxID=2305183 RepID=A0ABW4WZR0_9BACT|nr:RagB/SusD family nutrient uptake outer membrane protein [Pontibacter silvestris]MCC9135521.1 RagB/SusD family nutrient uptake outer membrane protein [Pontibacter silvestris]